MSFIAILFQSPSIKTYMLVPNLCKTIQNGCWLSWSSKCWSSNVCAALGTGSETRSMEIKEIFFILMMGIWTDCRGCIIIIIPYFWLCLERVSWICFCQHVWSSSSGTCVLCWRSSNLITLSGLRMIIFISTFTWTTLFLSTSTSCQSWNPLLW